MKKAILIGNGFTSQLIKEYSDSIMKEKLLMFFADEYNCVNRLFDNFRIIGYCDKDLYRYDGGSRCADDLFVGEGLYLQSDSIFYNEKIREHVIKALADIGIQNNIELFDTYFIQYGLIFEVIKSEICSIENLLKVISMFKAIGRTDDKMETKIKQIAKNIYYNDGKYGLINTNLQDYSKIGNFFSNFDFIFTTNYDLILDDICENQREVFHLHGGFNIEHRNLKSTKRLSADEAYMVWGINGDEKYKELSPGMDLTNFRFDAVRFGQSLLAEYFSYLENNPYEVLHIFGFSGENDQHINKRIMSNSNLKKIIYYCNPNNVGNYNYECKVKDLFRGTNKLISFEPWTSIWNQIR